ncbi:MAG: hypothetical protein WBQ21_06500 [Solirubrobacteraceae bacterium]
MTFRTFFTDTARREDGLTLIEVVITALLVGLIAVGTLTGFQALDRASADERFHNQAVLLATQSQEQLRSDPANTLNLLADEPLKFYQHSYTTKVDGTLYTITQEATYFNESKPGSDCLATAASESSSKEDGDYLRVTSSITWPQLISAKRKPVSQSSIITPPDGSALEVDATNGAYPESALSGVTAKVKYIGVESTEVTPLEGTTGAAGCIVFGGIPATSAKVEITELSGFVTTSGAVKVPIVEKTIAPNITTHDPVVLNEGGAITAEFTYGGKHVEGSTFVAYNAEDTNSSEYTVGATKFEYQASGEHKYKALTETYATTATTPMGSSYPKGDLFPFPFNEASQHKSKWQVFAGDCKENNAHTIDNAVADGEAVVLPGQTEKISVPMTDLVLNVYTGTSSTPEALAKTLYKVKITDTECEKSSIPNNATAANLIHEQSTTNEGHLEHAYQPFGQEKVCLYNPTEKHTFTLKPELNTPTEHIDTIYLKEKTTTYHSPVSNDEIIVASSTTC